MNTDKHEKLLYKELSYQIQGAAIEVRKNFGSGLKEVIYQSAFAEELKSRNIQFEKEKSIQIFSPKTRKLIGSYRPDFIIDGKILVEIKAVEKIPKMFIDQLYSYLRNSKYELGYFINFVSPRLYIKRIIYTNNYKTFALGLKKETGIKLKTAAKLSCLLVFLFVLFGVYTAEAAQLSLNAIPTSVTVGQQLEVSVMLDAQGEKINAVEGGVIFPADILDFEDVLTGGSIIGLWVQNPSFSRILAGGVNYGKVEWGGTISGGFNGVMDPYKTGLQPGKIMTVVFVAKKPGSVLLKVQDARALLNDGLGTETKTTTKGLALIVEENPGTDPAPSSTTSSLITSDAYPPESFTPQVVKDPNVFDGKWFLVFAALDKGSGIDHYEVMETNHVVNTVENGVIGASPYLLKDQSLRSYIYVKAVDKAGNVTVAVVFPKFAKNNWQSGYTYIVFAIMIAGIVAVYLVHKFKRKKYIVSSR